MRQAFLDAVNAFIEWEGEVEPEPRVELQENFIAREITISEACGIL